MSDLYVKVQKERRPKWDHTIWYWGAAAAVITVAILTPVLLMSIHQYRFHGFLRDVSSSSLYARIGAVTCTVDGKTDTVTTDELSKLLMMLTDGGCGKPMRKLPQEAPFRVDFYDGAVLKLWRGEIKDSYTGDMIPSLIVSFVNKDGKAYSYLTHLLSVRDLRYVLPDVAKEWVERNIDA